MLSREQHAVREFHLGCEPLRRIAGDGALKDMADAVFQAIASFGVAELGHRQAERYAALNLHAGRVLHTAQSAARDNEAGLRALATARQAMADVAKQLQDFPDDRKLDERMLDRAQQDVREALAELETKSADTLKLDKTVSALFDVMRVGGPRALPDYLAARIDELDRVRRLPDRGAVDNIPVWKIIAIAVAIGIWIWAYIKCGWFGSCSVAEGTAYAIIFFIAALVVYFC